MNIKSLKKALVLSTIMQNMGLIGKNLNDKDSFIIKKKYGYLVFSDKGLNVDSTSILGNGLENHALTLADSGIETGYYFGVDVDAKGRVVKGVKDWSLSLYGDVIALDSGKVDKPSLCFKSDLSTGLYCKSTGEPSISVKGSDYISFFPDTTEVYKQFNLEDGSSKNCALSFNAIDTGIFRQSSNTIGMSISGKEAFRISKTGIVNYNTIKLIAGTIKQPALSFASDNTSGFYIGSLGEFCIACKATLITSIINFTIIFNVPLQLSNGSLDAPALIFRNGYGLSLINNDMCFVTQSKKSLQITHSSIDSHVPVSLENSLSNISLQGDVGNYGDISWLDTVDTKIAAVSCDNDKNIIIKTFEKDSYISLKAPGGISCKGNVISNVRDPIRKEDVVTKKYLDDQIESIRTKNSGIIDGSVASPAIVFKSEGNGFARIDKNFCIVNNSDIALDVGLDEVVFKANCNFVLGLNNTVKVLKISKNLTSDSFVLSFDTALANMVFKTEVYGGGIILAPQQVNIVECTSQSVLFNSAIKIKTSKDSPNTSMGAGPLYLSSKSGLKWLSSINSTNSLASIHLDEFSDLTIETQAGDINLQCDNLQCNKMFNIAESVDSYDVLTRDTWYGQPQRMSFHWGDWLGDHWYYFRDSFANLNRSHSSLYKNTNGWGTQHVDNYVNYQPMFVGINEYDLNIVAGEWCASLYFSASAVQQWYAGSWFTLEATLGGGDCIEVARQDSISANQSNMDLNFDMYMNQGYYCRSRCHSGDGEVCVYLQCAFGVILHPIGIY